MVVSIQHMGNNSNGGGDSAGDSDRVMGKIQIRRDRRRPFYSLTIHSLQLHDPGSFYRALLSGILKVGYTYFREYLKVGVIF